MNDRTPFETAQQAAIALDATDRERFAAWFADWHFLVTPAAPDCERCGYPLQLLQFVNESRPSPTCPDCGWRPGQPVHRFATAKGGSQ